MSQVQTHQRYEVAAQEDRCAPRTRISIPATLRASGGRSFSTIVHDLSLGGVCASASNRRPPGPSCWLQLPGLESLQSEVIWWNNSLIGCAFQNLLSPIVHDNILARWQPETIFRSTL